MASLIGQIGSFDPKNELFPDYSDRMDAFMAVNGIAEGQRGNCLLATVGAECYRLLKDLCAPATPTSKSYEQLKAVLTDHYEPQPIVIAERHKFWTACQGEAESTADFTVRLKHLASTCSFGAFLDEALRDRLVSGLHSKMSRTQRQLLAVRELTFQKAREKCIADELATKANTEHMGAAAAATTDVHNVSTANGSNRYKKGSKSRPKGNQRAPAASGGCESCGNNHSRADCKYRDATCHKCGRKGHIKPVCRSSVNTGERSARDRKTVHSVNQPDSVSQSDASEEQFGLYHTQTDAGTQPYRVTVTVAGQPIHMEVDTGASRSTVSEYVYETQLKAIPLVKTDLHLRSYTGERVPLLGELEVPVDYDGKPTKKLRLYVVKGRCPALLGRDWLQMIKLNWQNIFAVKEEKASYPPELQELLQESKEVFVDNGTGIQGFSASLKLKPDAEPVFQKSRSVPYAVVPEADKAYDKLIDSKILHPVTYSDWASPVVHVPKKDGSIRVCGDYKAVNEQIEDDNYGLPNVQDLFAMLSQPEGVPTVFSVIDLSGAFNQLLLDEESAHILTLSTRRGLLATNRLCFGVKTAPAQFQRVIEKILFGLPGVVVRVDDILVATNGVESHIERLREIMARFKKHNVKVNGSKCQFMTSKVIYMGYQVSDQGVHPVESKLEAIRKAPTPTNVSELRSFLGMINAYGIFVQELSSKMHPLFELLRHEIPWDWTKECDRAFQYAKGVISSDQVLVHYDPRKPLVLSVDASPYGLGAVLSHRMPDGTERPIEHASRTLSSAEKNYSQIEKEALAIIFGVKKFHLYLFGRKFALVTDHQPLTKIFGPKSGIPPLAAARMQRWALLLSGYNYDIEYRKSADNAEADCFSRLPLPDGTADEDENYVFQTVVDKLPVQACEVAKSTRADPLFGKVYEFVSSGWSNQCSEPELQPFWSRREELSLEDGCLLWGRRVLIPPALQPQLIEELHDCHPGICRMKALARSFVWWPGIDIDLENVVRTCAPCVKLQNRPKHVPLLLWPWASSPWQRIHMDFCEIDKQMFLIVVDSHSKWLEVFPMNSTTATATVNLLRSLFASQGLALEVVTDNGPQFISEEFKRFLRLNGVKHTLCPPYHPASNGLAERYVKTFKDIFRKMSSGTVSEKVSRALFHYRNVPHTTTGKTPAELFLKRTPRTQLSMIKPALARKVEDRQSASKVLHDGPNPVMRTFDLYQPVMVANMRGREKWIPGTVVEIKGLETYIVRVPGNARRLVHANHIIPDDSRSSEREPHLERESHFEPEVMETIPPPCFPSRDIPTSPVTRQPETSPPVTLEVPSVDSGTNPRSVSPTKPVRPTVPPSTPLRSQVGQTITRSGRVSVPPVRFDM